MKCLVSDYKRDKRVIGDTAMIDLFKNVFICNKFALIVISKYGFIGPNVG